MPQKHFLKIVFWAMLLALLASLFPLLSVSGNGEINDPNKCEFQPPTASRTSTLSSIRIDYMILGSGNKTPDLSFPGLHSWGDGSWPGVDYLVPTTVAFKNGGTIRKAGWDTVGGGHSLYIDGEGPCAGWLIYIGHLDYNPESRYSPGQHIGPDEIIGEPGCSGFEANCIDKGSAIPKHNHYTLGYSSNIFAFSDGTTPASIGSHYWIHPARVEGVQAPTDYTSMVAPDFLENGSLDAPEFMDHTNGQLETSSLEWVKNVRLPLSIPVWAYFSIPVSLMVLAFKKVRPIGFGGIAATAILIFGFYYATPVSAEPPPQLIYISSEDMLDIPSAEGISPTTPPTTAYIVQEDGKPSKNPADYPLNQSTPCEVAASYPDSIQQWCGLITYYAKLRGLDPNLIAAVMTIESYAGQVEPCDEKDGHQVIDGIAVCGSKDGAAGMMQVMPRDGKSAIHMCINGPCFWDRPSFLELLNPETNIFTGTGMLMEKGAATNPRQALFAYGPAGVGYSYADSVLAVYNSHR